LGIVYAVGHREDGLIHLFLLLVSTFSVGCLVDGVPDRYLDSHHIDSAIPIFQIYLVAIEVSKPIFILKN
jgi:hypothetical protein